MQILNHPSHINFSDTHLWVFLDLDLGLGLGKFEIKIEI